MTIFTSRSAESYDPKPWIGSDGLRAATREQTWGTPRYDPRPEFEPTSDEFPFVYPSGARSMFSHGDGMALRWAPRDRNRNRILIAFRVEAALQLAAGGFGVRAQARLWLDRNEGAEEATPAEVEHARKVLTRLANVYGVDA